MKGIYIITNSINNKSYIGMSNDIKRRWRAHLNELRKNKHHSVKLQNAFNKYGEEAFEFKILLEVESMDGLEDKEKAFIAQYDSYKNGYNCSEGGEHLPGYKIPETTRQALIKRNKGNKYSLGRTHTEEYKKHMSNLHSGENNPFFNKKHSKETLDIISEKVKERYKDDVYRKTHADKLTEINRSEKRRKEVSEQVKGENNANASVTEFDAINIRLRYLKGEKPASILKDYANISASGLRKICYNSTWKHIPNTIEELESMLINYQL